MSVEIRFVESLEGLKMNKASGQFTAWLMALWLLTGMAVSGQAKSPVHPARAIPATEENAAVLVAAGSTANTGSRSLASNDTAVITFVNEDRLHGTLKSIEPEEYGLRWSSSTSSKCVDFLLESVALVTLPQVQARQTKSAAAVKLTNGDELSGNIVLLDRTKLILETRYCGKLVIVRSMLKAIVSASVGSVVFEGPDELKNWIAGKEGGVESWKLKDGALYAMDEQAIGRYIEDMPEVAKMEFEMRWTGPSELLFWFYASKLAEGEAVGCYMVRICGNDVYIMRQAPNEEQKVLGQANVAELIPKGDAKIKIGIMVSKKDKRIVLMVNGRVVIECLDSGTFVGSGNGIRFQCQSSETIVSIRDIRISRWDGSVPTARSDDTGAKDDSVRLINGDMISGTLKSVAAGKATIKTPFGELNIPLERTEVIRFASAGLERARRNKHDIKAAFIDGGQVTIELMKLAEGKIEGRSENFGSVTMPTDMFRQLEFNIYRPPPESEDNTSTPASEQESGEVDQFAPMLEDL